MKSITKKNTIILSTFFSILILISFVIITLINIKLTCVGFYQVSSENQRAIVSFLQKNLAQDNGKPVKFGIITYNEKEDFFTQYEQNPCDLLFTKDGEVSRTFAKSQKLKFNPTLIETMPSTMKKTSKNIYYPIIFDHFEVLSKTKIPNTLDSFVEHAKSLIVNNQKSVFFAGNEDETLLQLITALTEAKYGYEGLNSVIKVLKQNCDFACLLDARVAENATFRDVLQELINWKKSGILYDENYNMKESDLLAMIEYGLPEIVFLPLSTHRKIPSRSLETYTSTVFPATNVFSKRCLVAPAVVGIPITERKFFSSKTATNILQSILESENMSQLALSSKLIPASLSARTADIQASDARLWIASASLTTNHIATESFLSVSKTYFLAESIRTYLKTNGIVIE